MSIAPTGTDAVSTPPLSGTPFAGAEMPVPEDLNGHGVLAGIRNPTDLSACLLPLLEVIGWQGHPQQVAEALPHFVDDIDLTSFLNVMATLGYRSRSEKTGIGDVEPDSMPCLFLPDGGDAFILVGADEGHIEAFNSTEGRYISMAEVDAQGTAYFFSPIRTGLVAAGAAAGDWFWSVGERFRPQAYEALAITLAVNLLALATPFFIIAAYDHAIGGGSALPLAYLAIGVGVALAAETALRLIRARIFSFMGARVDNIVGVEVFRKILNLPTAMIERAAVGAQVARIRAFETVRAFFTGPAAPVVIELPFIVIFIAVIAILGGILALVPVVALALAYGIGRQVMPWIGDAMARAAAAAAKRQELMVETLGAMRAIKYLGAETTWLERCRHVSADAATQHFRARRLSALLDALAHVILAAAGVATLALGVDMVKAGTMSQGALAASLFLVWRALAPMQAGLRSLAQTSEVETGIGQLNDLMEIPVERDGGIRPWEARRQKGQITFVDVTMRYDPDARPALDDVNFDIKGGMIVAVLGGNGAGKSTMLKLLAGLYQTEFGSIMIDDRDVRDIEPAELRSLISYVPQSPHFFYGTIAQNLRLAHPTANDDDLRWAARQAGALDDIETLEQGAGDWKRTGFDVRLGDGGSGQLSPGLLQRLSLARGYLKRAPVVLLDEPGNGLDLQGDQSLMRALANLRGQKTVFIVTHRPSHLKMADRIIWLENGTVRAVGRSKVVMQSTGGRVI